MAGITQLNSLTVTSVEECKTNTDKVYVRMITKGIADNKGFVPTYILMVWNSEIISKCKKIEMGAKIDAYCKWTIFFNKKNDAQDISYTLLDFDILESDEVFGKTTVDKAVNIRNVVITKIKKGINPKTDKPYYTLNGFSEQGEMLCNFNLSAFNDYVVKRVDDTKLKEKSCINCCATISPFKRERNGKVYQDYSYILLDFEFAEHRKKEEEVKSEVKPYSPTEKEHSLDDFDIFKRSFTEKL